MIGNIKEISTEQLEQLQKEITVELRFRLPDVRIREMVESIKTFVAEGEYTDATELEIEMIDQVFLAIINGCEDPISLCKIAKESLDLDYERFL